MVNRPMAEIIHGQTPLTLRPDATVQDACKNMHTRRFGAVLVVDEGGRLIGIFTGRDAVRCLAENMDPSATSLDRVMTPNPHAMPPETKAIEALRLMRDGGFRHVPVVRDGLAVGIVSRDDFRGLERDRLEAEIELWERI